MKTGGMAVLCDACGVQILPIGYPGALFVTIKGPLVGHKKADLCSWACLKAWSGERMYDAEALQR